MPRHLGMILEEAAASLAAVLLGLHPAVSPRRPAAAARARRARAGVGARGRPAHRGRRRPHRPRGHRDRAPRHPERSRARRRGAVRGSDRHARRRVPAAGRLRSGRILRRLTLSLQIIVLGGKEHQLLMGTPQEPRIHRAVSNAVPCLHRVALTPGGCNWLHAAVALRDPRPGQARNAGTAALGAHPSLKRVVVVDADVDVFDTDAIEWAIATRVQPDRDVVIIPGRRGLLPRSGRATAATTRPPRRPHRRDALRPGSGSGVSPCGRRGAAARRGPRGEAHRRGAGAARRGRGPRRPQGDRDPGGARGDLRRRGPGPRPLGAGVRRLVPQPRRGRARVAPSRWPSTAGCAPSPPR
ncbi:MAG: UbiD family decarboxylase [Sphingobacterium sp.]|nr:UbiD family decarboxylase [Sphingobacterium sp.]